MPSNMQFQGSLRLGNLVEKHLHNDSQLNTIIHSENPYANPVATPGQQQTQPENN